jgi:uncharacterized protein (DUF1330 family)
MNPGAGFQRFLTDMRASTSSTSSRFTPVRACHHDQMTAYVIAEAEHLDTPEVRAYRELSKASIAQYGGRYLVRGALPEALEGEWADGCRMVVIEFPSLERAKSWYTSEEYAAARATRSGISGRRILFVDGVGAA